QVDVAKDQLAQAQANLAEVLAGPTQDQKNQAEAAFHAAEALRDKLKTGGTSDASALQLATTTADQALQQAKATYNQMLAVLQQSQTAKQTAEANLAEAHAALEAAQVTLDEAEVRAPVGGVVSEKNASEGALVGPSTPIVTLVPPGLELDVPVEESNLAQVQ